MGKLSGNDSGDFPETFSKSDFNDFGAWLRGFPGNFFQNLWFQMKFEISLIRVMTQENFQKLFPVSGKSFRKFSWVITRIFEISNFILNHRFWKKFPENSLSHAPKSFKSLLEKVSGKSPESFPESLPIWVKLSKKLVMFLTHIFYLVKFLTLTLDIFLAHIFTWFCFWLSIMD